MGQHLTGCHPQGIKQGIQIYDIPLRCIEVKDCIIAICGCILKQKQIATGTASQVVIAALTQQHIHATVTIKIITVISGDNDVIATTTNEITPAARVALFDGIHSHMCTIRQHPIGG